MPDACTNVFASRFWLCTRPWSTLQDVALAARHVSRIDPLKSPAGFPVLLQVVPCIVVLCDHGDLGLCQCIAWPRGAELESRPILGSRRPLSRESSPHSPDPYLIPGTSHLVHATLRWTPRRPTMLNLRHILLLGSPRCWSRARGARQGERVPAIRQCRVRRSVVRCLGSLPWSMSRPL